MNTMKRLASTLVAVIFPVLLFSQDELGWTKQKVINSLNQPYYTIDSRGFYVNDPKCMTIFYFNSSNICEKIGMVPHNDAALDFMIKILNEQCTVVRNRVWRKNYKGQTYFYTLTYNPTPDVKYVIMCTKANN